MKILSIIAILLFASVQTVLLDSLPSNCFFTVGGDGKAFWFVDPQGNPFFSKGVDNVNPYGDRGQDGSTIYQNAVNAKYNGNLTLWAQATATQMKSWNLNTLGAWSSNLMFNQGIAYTVILTLAGSFPTNGYLFPDVFDPAFQTHCALVASASAAPNVNDPYLLGYFLDNELYWGYDWRGSYSLLAMFLNQTGYGYQAAQNYLTTKYNNNIASLNSAWNITAPSFSNLKSVWPYPDSNANYSADATAFQRIVVNQYFNVTTSTVRRVDPNHLILGCKHAGLPSDAVMSVEGQYSDVFSFDAYGATVPVSVFNSTYLKVNRPIMIGEFSFRGADSGLPNTVGAGDIVANQSARADAYQLYIETAAASPYTVGVHWFEWVDEPASGRFDGENSNYGLVNGSNMVYQALTNRMTTVNSQLDAIHEFAGITFTAKCNAAPTCPANCNGNGCCVNGTCQCISVYNGADCASYAGNFSDSFQTLSYARWYNMTDYPSGGHFFTSSALSIDQGGLKIQVSPCSPSVCYGQSAKTGGILSNANYGYGTMTASVKLSKNVDENFFINWIRQDDKNPTDGVTIRYNSNGTYSSVQVGRYNMGANAWDNSIPISFDPSLDFHNFTIVRTNASVLVTLDQMVLGNYNTTIPTLQVPIVFLYWIPYSPPNPNAYAIIQSVTYTPATVVVPVCPTTTGQSLSTTTVPTTTTSAATSSGSTTTSKTNTATTASNTNTATTTSTSFACTLHASNPTLYVALILILSILL